MVRSSGSKRWRQHKQPRNHTVLVWMGTSPDSRFKSTTGWIPTRLNCLFVVEYAELSSDGLLAMVQTFATVPICQTASMVICRGDISTCDATIERWKLPLLTSFQCRNPLYSPYTHDPRGCPPSFAHAVASKLAVVLEQPDWLVCLQFVLHVRYSIRCLK